MQPSDLVSLVSGGVGAISVLAFFLQLFIRHKLHADDELAELARHYEAQLAELREDRNYWRSISDRLLVTQERIVPPLIAGSGEGRKPS